MPGGYPKLNTEAQFQRIYRKLLGEIPARAFIGEEGIPHVRAQSETRIQDIHDSAAQMKCRVLIVQGARAPLSDRQSNPEV